MEGDAAPGVELTNLDQQLFEGAGATKGRLVTYLDGVNQRILPALRDRPLTVVRVTHGQAPFMQKNLPKHAPDWIPRLAMWAEASKRTVVYPICNDRRTLLWLANQRAIEYHPALVRADRLDHVTHLVLDLDPPDAARFDQVVGTARLVRRVLAEHGLDGAVKTSGATGLHVFVPIGADVQMADAAAATRAIARRVELADPALATTAFVKADRQGKVFVDSTRTGGATVVAAYSPRARAGLPVSFPLGWDDVGDVDPADFTILNALRQLGDRDPWAEMMPPPQELPARLIAEGMDIPIARVAAMHEGKRRARARRKT